MKEAINEMLDAEAAARRSKIDENTTALAEAEAALKQLEESEEFYGIKRQLQEE